MRGALILMLLAAPAMAEEVAVPSGQPVTFVDVVQDAPGPYGLTIRFRFIAPRIAEDSQPFETSVEDMQFLCDSFALPRVASTGPAPSQIIVTLMDRPVEFGVTDEEATQFFEAYRIEDTACVWEAF